MKLELAVGCLLYVLDVLSLVNGANSTSNDTSNGTDDTPATSMTTELPVLHTSTDTGWERGTIMKLSIGLLVVVAIVGAIFLVRYMRTEKRNNAKKRYARLSKAEDDEEIELSIYEKST